MPLTSQAASDGYARLSLGRGGDFRVISNFQTYLGGPIVCAPFGLWGMCFCPLWEGGPPYRGVSSIRRHAADDDSRSPGVPFSGARLVISARRFLPNTA